MREQVITGLKPKWPQVNAEKCIDERPLRKLCQSVWPTLIV
jgi:hypothetical protein